MSPVAIKEEVSYLVKKSSGVKGLTETEFHSGDFHEIRYPEADVYYREIMMLFPIDLEPGQTSFGRVEQRRVSDDVITATFPVFCRIEAIVGGRRAVFTAFFPGGGKLEIAKDYESNEMYAFPMRESHVISLFGEVSHHMIFAREK